MDIRDKNYIRSLVKDSVYLNFYGGGQRTIKKKIRKFIKFCIQELNYLREVSDNYRLGISIPHATEQTKLEDLKVIVIDALISIKLHDNNPNIYQYVDNLAGIAEELLNYIYGIESYSNDSEAIYQHVIEYFRLEYPGLLESFELLQRYVEDHKCTYPTFLGWQTPLSEGYRYNHKDIITKSKSYVIQGAGAEFMREWLLEVMKIYGYTNTFHIVNTIHDQIMIEARNDISAKLKIDILEAAKRAAENVGIDPETLHIPEPETVYIKSNRGG